MLKGNFYVQPPSGFAEGGRGLQVLLKGAFYVHPPSGVAAAEARHAAQVRGMEQTHARAMRDLEGECAFEVKCCLEAYDDLQCEAAAREAELHR